MHAEESLTPDPRRYPRLEACSSAAQRFAEQAARHGEAADGVGPAFQSARWGIELGVLLWKLDPDFADALLAEIRTLREETNALIPSPREYREAEVRQVNAITRFTRVLADNHSDEAP